MGGGIAKWWAYLLPDQLVRIKSPSFQILAEEKIVAEVNQWRCLEESEQWLDVVDRTHLVLASGKLVLQKSYITEKTSQTNL